MGAGAGAGVGTGVGTGKGVGAGVGANLIKHDSVRVVWHFHKEERGGLGSSWSPLGLFGGGGVHSGGAVRTALCRRSALLKGDLVQGTSCSRGDVL